jgi:hypothetical protein
VQPGNVESLLDGHWDTVQWSADTMGHGLIGGGGILKCRLPAEFDHRVQGRIDRVNPG